METMMKVKEESEKLIKNILNDGINSNNLEDLSDLVDIHKDIANEEYWCMKEEESEMYGNYGNYSGRRPGYDTYGRNNYGNYGARGRDMRYRGDEELDRVMGDYNRYQESRSRYGASEESNKSFHYMVKSLEDFIKVLHEEAETPQQKQMLNETLQRSMM